MESSGGNRTLGRIFGYLLLSDKPRSLDQIACDLLFSKATASLTVRQGLMLQFLEKVSISGERKDYYRANIKSWVSATSAKIRSLSAWETLIDRGLELLNPENKASRENLVELKDYFNFTRWYLSDFEDQYKLWKKGEIKDGIYPGGKQ